MEDKAKRPLSIWIAQILLAIFLLVFALGFLLAFLKVGTSLVISEFGFVYFAIMALFGIAFWGMARRESFGRWISVGLLALILMFSLFSLFAILTPDGAIQRYEYLNSTERMAGVLTLIFMSVLLLVLILRLSFARNVTDFFR